MTAKTPLLTDATCAASAEVETNQRVDVTSHLPVLLIGLRWMFDTPQPDTALQHHHGQQISSVGNRTLRFIPSGWNGHAIVVVEVTHVDYGQPRQPPRNPLDPGELAAFIDLLDGMGEDVVATWNGSPATTGSLALARPAHPALQASVRRYSRGCPQHGGHQFCRCDWYDRGRRQLVSIQDLHREALQRRMAAQIGCDAATEYLTALGGLCGRDGPFTSHPRPGT